jgi:hypothetical protein
VGQLTSNRVQEEDDDIEADADAKEAEMTVAAA